MTTDRLSGVVLALVAAAVIEESWRLRLPLGTLATPGPSYFPVVLAVVMLVAGVLIVVLGGGAPRVSTVRWNEWRHAAAIVVAIAFAAIALERLGYRLTMLLTCAFLVGLVERKGIIATLLISVGMSAGTYFLFDTLLRVQLPRGLLGY